MINLLGIRPGFGALITAAVLSPKVLAQIPDGYIVWSSQQGTPGQNGIFYSHPRDPLAPIGIIGNLPPALAYSPAGARGGASVLYRRSDGALIAGERAPNGTSVDLHVLHLRGDNVYWAQTFSVGTGIATGEICQAGLLPDGRVIVAASGLSQNSALAQALTTQYQWEGIGIVDTVGGGVTPIVIPNLAQVPGVVNGLAVTNDGLTIYFCNWVSNLSGGLWSVPVAGGPAVSLATLPGGPSSVSIDSDGRAVLPILAPGLGSNVYRYDPTSSLLTPIQTTAGPLNCLGIETVTGNFVVATRETGAPPRSLYWMTPDGSSENLLVSPNMATINGIDINPNPEVVASGTRGNAAYDWVLTPNPGGLPLVGSQFSLTLRSDVNVTGAAIVVIGFGRLPAPINLLGADFHVDPARAIVRVVGFANQATLPLSLPGDPSLRGLRFYAQSLHDEGRATLASSSLLEATIL